MRRTAAVALILIVGASFAGISMLPQARAKTFYVGGTGPGNYTSVQGAVNVAGAGDTVFIYNGTYYENIQISESIHLVGEDRNNTIIDGGREDNVIYISKSTVSIKGLTITNSNLSWTHAGVNVYYGTLHLTKSRISNNLVGVHIRYGSQSTIADNLFLSNKLESIYLDESSQNWAYSNMMVDNGCGVGIGGTSLGNAITGNNMSSNRGGGIWMSGLLGMQPRGNAVHKNVISGGHEGIFLWNGYANDITFNNFIDNNVSAFLLSDERDHCYTNNWDYNYWSDYEGRDRNGDGIGDKPYVIECYEHGTYHYNNSDPHPRMYTAMEYPGWPSEPRDLIARADTSSVTLTWKPPLQDRGSPVTGYRIYWGTHPAFLKFRAETGNVLSYVDSGLVSTTYYYEVTAVNIVAEGPPSDLANATVGPLPGPPRDLHASLGGTGLKDVVLGWTLSADDTGGNKSVALYDIYRNVHYDPNASGYEMIASLPRTSQEFVDFGVGEGNTATYFYRVCATTYSNTTSCSVDQAGKFARALSKGFNLVSVPFIQSDESTETVLRTVEYDKAWSYDSYYQEWKSYMRQKTYRGDLLNINHTMGLWVNVTEDSNLTVVGVVSLQTTILLSKGWNLVSFPSVSASYTVADLKAEVPVERVETFDPSVPPHFLSVLPDSSLLLPGRGYWVKTSRHSTWIVSNM